jgi:hypothetical protein
MTAVFPDRSEATEYYFNYINLVSQADICATLEAQGTEALATLRGMPASRAAYRYAPGKWSIGEVIAHLNDTERLFVFRAFWFARGFDSPLPSFEQEVALSASGAAERSWESLLEEFQTIRAATLTFFRNLPPEAWSRRGIASGNPFSVRALAFLVAGHTTHHLRILAERYK